jgi:hypothetical protein
MRFILCLVVLFGCSIVAADEDGFNEAKKNVAVMTANEYRTRLDTLEIAFEALQKDWGDIKASRVVAATKKDRDAKGIKLFPSKAAKAEVVSDFATKAKDIRKQMVAESERPKKEVCLFLGWEKVGDVCLPDYRFEVSSVQSETEVLAYFIGSDRKLKGAWISGVPTKGMDEGKMISLGRMVATGTKTYDNAAGGKQTVLVIKPAPDDLFKDSLKVSDAEKKVWATALSTVDAFIAETKDVLFTLE